MLWKFSHACFSHSSFLNNWECFSTVSSTTSQFIRQQGLEAQSFLLGGPPGFCCRLFPGGITQRTLRAQFNGLFLLHHLTLIYPFKISNILSTKGEPYTVLKAKIQSVHTLLCKSTSVMPELTTQSMERLKSLAKQDQEHVACIHYFHHFLHLVS